MEKKLKHLEMIVRIIERMEKNSFSLKSWTMTLLVAICALSVNDSEKRFILIAGLPTITFWLLDSFYLYIESKYRILYKIVSKRKESEIDFSMDINNIALSKCEMEKIYFIKCLFSFSEILFYLPLIIGIVLIICLLKIF
ncbi:hypothetical protein [Parablautia muri]|uniref:Uncharacterized protein n=1 Tax=Parablautia muri TaxID=2320879 RepID=A0A9X5BCX9_9FIRM|nr:hypothetical protein [Parablautia muri]NBJ91379.1 hypothetical protein [Parablautia muri]